MTVPLSQVFVRETTAGTFLGAITFGLIFGFSSKSSIKTLKLATLGGLGFLIGGMLGYHLYVFFDFFSPAFTGAIGGAFYGVAMGKIKLLASFSSLGLLLGTIVGIITLENILLSFTSYGIIVGAFLSTGMYFAEKEG